MGQQNGKTALWALQPEQLLEQMKSSEKGISRDEAAKRLLQYGPNEIARKDKRSSIEIFASQFSSPLVVVLIIAAGIAYFLEPAAPTDTMVILAIVVMNAVLGFIQEFRAEKALRELRRYIPLKSKVLRDGEIIEIDSREIVPGDMVHLNIGDVVPADIRLLHAEDFTADESSLTGESVPVLKGTSAVDEKRDLPQFLTNIAFMGTTVQTGEGKGVVIAAGGGTFFGRTAAYLKHAGHETDFHRNIGKFGNMLLKAIVVMTALIFVANAWQNRGLLDSGLFALALAVGITPEMLPIIITISLSNGALKMAKKKVITKKLVSVEDLGNIDTLCCDKTGTLTEGALSLRNYVNLEGVKDERLVVYGMLCNSLSGEKRAKETGNAIDRAILQSSEAARLQPDAGKFTVLDDNEFDYGRRRISVVAKGSEGNILIVKGAPEAVLSASKFAKIRGRKEALSEEIESEIKSKISAFEEEGYTVIGVGEKKTAKQETTKEDETGLTFAGFLLFMDPPKKDAKESLRLFERLGVNIKIVSGDSPRITRKVCNEVELKIADGRVITGEELELLGEKEFEEYAWKYNVFARVTPEQKYRIVSMLNKEGHIVGFLGDGVNDAPALRAADVGISVDTATGVAKEAAEIILLQKSLGVLAEGITTGRKTFGNITKYILNTISANFGNMFTVALSSLFLPFIPLLPSQILLNNFVSDIPLITVSTDNVDKDFVRKPKRWDIRFISRFMIFFGLISTAFDLALIACLIFIFNAEPALFRTAWFVESCLSEIIITFAVRTRLPFFRSVPSKFLIIASLETIFVAVAVTYLAFGAEFFQFVPMPLEILGLIFGVLAAYFAAVEIGKRVFFRENRAQGNSSHAQQAF